jgi:hypothetical protein
MRKTIKTALEGVSCLMMLVLLYFAYKDITGTYSAIQSDYEIARIIREDGLPSWIKWVLIGGGAFLVSVAHAFVFMVSKPIYKIASTLAMYAVFVLLAFLLGGAMNLTGGINNHFFQHTLPFFATMFMVGMFKVMPYISSCLFINIVVENRDADSEILGDFDTDDIEDMKLFQPTSVGTKISAIIVSIVTYGVIAGILASPTSSEYGGAKAQEYLSWIFLAQAVILAIYIFFSPLKEKPEVAAVQPTTIPRREVAMPDIVQPDGQSAATLVVPSQEGGKGEEPSAHL